MARTAARRRAPRKPARPQVPARRIRWERLGRAALLGVLGVILLLYISPAKHWITQSQTASHQDAELQDLKREHTRLERQVRSLRSPGSLEREVRRLGMVRNGERAYSVENLPR
ncbi:MAG: septum formation initiator family protein [Thermoleophilaceae bacterium]